MEKLACIAVNLIGNLIFWIFLPFLLAKGIQSLGLLTDHIYIAFIIGFIIMALIIGSLGGIEG